MRSPYRAALPALLLALSLAAACEDRDGSTAPIGPTARVSEVVVTPRVDTVFVRDSLAPTDRVQLRATVLGFGGSVISGASVRWRTADTTIVQVDSLTGLVVPRRVGTATVTASAGGKEGTATVVIEYAAARITIQPRVQVAPTPGQPVRTADTIFVRDPITPQNFTSLRVLAVGPAGDTLSGFRYTWTSSNPAVATVDSAGNVFARAIGTTTITVRGAGLEASRPVTVASVVRDLRISAPTTTVLTEDTLRLTATVLGRDSLPLADPRVRWTSSNPQIATIDSTGLARFLTRGTVRFTATSHFVGATTGSVGNVENITVLDRVFRSVDVGGDFSCSTIELGRVYCWGINGAGQLGAPSDSVCFDGPSRCSLLPERTSTTLAFASVTAGEATTCGVAVNGRAYCWGVGSFGQLGNGTSGSVSAPALVTSALTFDSTAGGLSAGGSHVCGITAVARMVYCWGADNVGQMGTQVVRVSSTTPIPAEIPNFPNGPVPAQWVSAGGSHSCAIMSGGQAFCWGLNLSGAVGTGTVRDTIPLPTPIGAGIAFRSISASIASGVQAHTCALRGDGRAFCWGANPFGQTGTSSGVNLVATPTAVDAPVAFTQISAGNGFTCALGTDRAIYCWGLNDLGQLGHGDPPGGPYGAPLKIADPVALDPDGRFVRIGPVSFVSVSAGQRHACGVAVDGAAYCWGSDIFGALGTQLQARVQATPMRVAKPL